LGGWSGDENGRFDFDPATAAALRSHKDRQTFQRRSAAFWEENDLVICTGNGRILNPNKVLRNFAEIAGRSGVPRILKGGPNSDGR
jgi:hypothetical protein